jgi:GTPase
VAVSAMTGEGLDALRLAIETALSSRGRVYRVHVPHAAGADVGWLYGHAEIIGRDEPDEEGQTFEVRVEPRHNAAFTERFASRISSSDTA